MPSCWDLYTHKGRHALHFAAVEAETETFTLTSGGTWIQTSHQSPTPHSQCSRWLPVIVLRTSHVFLFNPYTNNLSHQFRLGLILSMSDEENGIQLRNTSSHTVANGRAGTCACVDMIPKPARSPPCFTPDLISE